MMRKTISAAAAVEAIPEGSRLMIGGFMGVGRPEQLIGELVPQGTLIERIRAGGYELGGVLTTTGVGTVVAEGKQTLEIDGTTFLVEKPIRSDYALIHAKQADYLGNLSYALTARNFNPVLAMAATMVIAEPQSIVPVGVIPPDAVVTPAVLVKQLVIRERANG